MLALPINPERGRPHALATANNHCSDLAPARCVAVGEPATVSGAVTRETIKRTQSFAEFAQSFTERRQIPSKRHVFRVPGEMQIDAPGAAD